jgi:hypothetical protein
MNFCKEEDTMEDNAIFNVRLKAELKVYTGKMV